MSNLDQQEERVAATLWLYTLTFIMHKSDKLQDFSPCSSPHHSGL